MAASDPFEQVRRLMHQPEFLRRIRETSDVVNRLDFLRRSGVFAAAERITKLTGVMPKPLQMPALNTTSEISRLFAGSSSATAFVDAQRITNRVAELMRPAPLPPFDLTRFTVPLKDILALSQRLADTTRSLARIQLPSLLEQAAGGSAQAWRIVVEDLPARPGEVDLERASIAGIEAVATASTVTLLGGEDLEDGLADPDTGPLALPNMIRTQLRDRLRGLDANLIRRLDGAWDRLASTGPDAASQAAHSTQELLDWTLRTAAPDPEVLPWHAANGGDPSRLDDKGKPTRTLRYEYLMRDRPKQTKAIKLYQRSVTDIVRALQEGKHSLEEPNGPHVVACLLLLLESLLAFVLHE